VISLHDPVLGSDGTLYVAAVNGLCAFDSSLNPKWVIPDTLIIRLAVSPGNTIYYADNVPADVYEASSTGSVLWQQDTGGVFGAPVLGPDGTLYMTCSNYMLYAIGSSGVQKWRMRVSSIQGVPAVGADGTVYLGTGSGMLAVDPSGSAKFLTHEMYYDSGPSIGPNGMIYGVATNGLYAFNPNGTQAWDVAANYAGNLALDGNGTLYVPNGSDFEALDAISGVETWSESSPLSGDLYFPIVSHSGLILDYGGSGSVAYNASGTNLWSLSFGGYGNLAVTSNGTTYTGDSGLNAYNSSGVLLWSQADYQIASNLALGGDGTIYFCTAQGSLCAAHPGTGAILWSYKLFTRGSVEVEGGQHVAVGPDGTIYVTGGDGDVHAID